MKKAFSTIVIINSLLLLGLFYWSFYTPVEHNLGATILQTATTDTIGTFRTNVNTSLDNLNNALLSLGSAAISTSSAVTTGYFPSWSGLNTISGTSSIFQSSSNIGIGTTAPSTTLDIIGTLRTSGAFYASSTATITGASIFGSTIQVGGSSSFLGALLASSTLEATGASIFRSTIQIPTSASALNIAGQIKINATTSTLVYYDGTAERALSSEQCDLDFVLESPTSAEDDYLRTFNAPATISKVYAVNKSLGDTATFNLVFGSSRSSSTSTTKSAFSSYTAITATTTPASLTLNGSTTIATGDVMRLITTAASSSQFGVTVCTRVNP